MGRALLWLETLAAVLLFTAFLVAVASRWRSRVLRGLVLLLPLLPIGATGFVTAVAIWHNAFRSLRSANLLIAPWIWEGLGLLALGSLVGYVWIVRRGLRRTHDTGIRAGQVWPRVRLAALGGLAAALWVMTAWNLNLSIRERQTAFRAEMAAEVHRVMPAPVPDDRNAAIVYAQASELQGLPFLERRKQLSALAAQARKGLLVARLMREQLRAYDDPYSGLGSDFEKMPLDRLRAALARDESVLRLVRRAAAMRDCYFQYEKMEGEKISPPEIGLSGFSHLLTLHAYLCVAEGRTKDALADVAAQQGILRHMRQWPHPHVLLSTQGMEAESADTLKLILARTRPTPDELESLSIDATASYARVFRRSIPFVPYDASRWFRSYNSLAEEVLSRILLVDDSIAAMRSAATQLERLASHPFCMSPKESWTDAARELQKWPAVILVLVNPSDSWVRWERAAQADAFHGLSQLAVAMAKYRAKQGEYPDRLEQLVPDYIDFIPFDPFDGKPLKLRREGDSLVLHSVDKTAAKTPAEGKEISLTLTLAAKR